MRISGRLHYTLLAFRTLRIIGREGRIVQLRKAEIAEMSYPSSGEPALKRSSLVAQGDHRIDFRRATRRDVARHRGHQRQHRDDIGKGVGIR